MTGFADVGAVMIGGLPATQSAPPEQPGETPVNFTPSTARTVKVQPGTRAFTSTGDFWDMSNPKKPRGLKDPNSTIDVSIDWSDWLADCGDSAASYSWTVDNGATKIAESPPSSPIASLFLSLGDLGAAVAATCRITTNSTPPRTEDRTVYLTIEDR